MFWRDQQRIIHWLSLVWLLLFVEVLLGGVARPFGFVHGGGSAGGSGWLPPLSNADWHTLFQHYQAQPRFRNINWGADLASFQTLYGVEYLHRLAGRLGALFFLLPWAWHVLKGHLQAALAMRLGLLAGMTAALQLAWEYPRLAAWAAPYDAALSMTLTLLVYSATLRTLLEVRHLERMRPPGRESAGVRLGAGLFLGVLFLALLSGNLVGLTGGGMVFNTFPLMNGRWIPGDLLLLTPEVRNFVENVATVQWEHRLLALFSLGAFLWLLTLLWRSGRLMGQRWEMIALAILLFGQLVLGVVNLLFMAPPTLAIAHQFLGMTLFSVALWFHQGVR